MSDNAEIKFMAAEITKLEHIIDDREAEIARLWAALDRIINYTPTTIIDGGGNPKVPLHCVHSIQYIARAAREKREVENG